MARRYSGSYVPQAGATPLPRVNYWGIWNEPNEGAWLNPQWRTVGRGGRVLIAPLLYRQLVDAAYSAFRATGHAHDTILIGETASRGWIYPIQFVDALYCVNSHNRPLVGTAATNLGCPRSGSRSQFAARNPGLFASEYAHHPYSFDTPPNRIVSPGLITLANLGVLERTLNGIFATYGKHPRGGVPMYLTEWGYKSNPPNPFVKTSLTQQATWLNQGEYMTWKDRYVRALDQFLLVDDKPRAGARKGSLSYWSTFQSGLLYRQRDREAGVRGVPASDLAAVGEPRPPHRLGRAEAGEPLADSDRRAPVSAGRRRRVGQRRAAPDLEQ